MIQNLRSFTFACLACTLLATPRAMAQDTGGIDDTDLPEATPDGEASDAVQITGTTFDFGNLDTTSDPQAPVDPAVVAPPQAIDVAPATLELNSVLVATFEADQAFLEPEADRVRMLVEDALRERGYVVVTMADVPKFPDYTADVYLRSCPTGQYIGCVFVVGGRAKTNWTIGGHIGAVDSGYRVDLSFIDVAEGKLVIELNTVLDGANDQAFKGGVSRTMDALVSGDLAHADLRGDPEAERAAAQAALQREREAKNFAADQIYQDPDAFDRGTSGMDAYVAPRDDIDRLRDDGKITMAELDAMEDRGGLTPWERADLTKAQYKLYRNSGRKLRDFQDKLRGRKGEIIFRLGMTVGSGSWGQAHDTHMLVGRGANMNSLQKSDVLVEQVVLKQEKALALGGQFEFGVGLTSWLEIDAFGGIRSAPYASRFVLAKKGTANTNIPDYDTKSVTSWEAGLKIGFAPLPAYPARPTLHLGASYWSGNRLAKVASDVPSFLIAGQTKPNNQIFVWIQPGFEVDAGKFIKIWGRVDLGIPVYGRNVQAYSRAAQGSKQSDLTIQPAVETFKGLSAGGSLGIAFHIRAAGK